jgi:serine/threonine protein phosphatase PrpC
MGKYFEQSLISHLINQHQLKDMPQCPICENNYRQKKPGKCSCCQWNLNSDINLVYDKIPKDMQPKFLRQQELTINWAKSLWQKYLSTETYLQEINAERTLLKDSLKLLESQFQQLQSITTSILAEINHSNQSENIVDNIDEPTQTEEEKDKISNSHIMDISNNEGEELMFDKLPCIVRSETNQRENNEDSFQIFQVIPIAGYSPITILAVADGMGGHAYGEEVSREALRKVSLALFEQLTFEPSINKCNPELTWNLPTLSKILMNALEQANAYVQRMAKNNNWGNAGSTIVIVMIWENTGIVGYLGDSPLFHYQPHQQKLTKITEDHTVAGVLLRAGMITPEMARVHEGKSRLEFYVGCPKLPREAPIHNINLTAGDVLLLCSDGISGAFREDEIRKILAQNGNNLDKIGEYLIKQSCSLGETDNQTLILWHHPQVSPLIVLSNNQSGEITYQQKSDPFKTEIQQQ